MTVPRSYQWLLKSVATLALWLTLAFSPASAKKAGHDAILVEQVRRGQSEALRAELARRPAFALSLGTRQTLLARAIAGQHAETLRVLLSRKDMPLNQPFRLREFPDTPLSPLAFAVSVGARPALIKLLVQAGARPDGADADDNPPPLHLAVFQGKFESVQALLEAGADPRRLSKGLGTSVLQELVMPVGTPTPEQLQRLLDLLLAHGCPVDLPDSRGDTALITAARYNQPVLAQLLLQAGARPELRNAQGQGALQVAMAKGHQAMVDLLLTQGAQP